ncbi:MAG: transferrin-binding protein-like solute binding protein [Bauldia sp.]
MKISYGILAAGASVCTLVLAGCSPGGGGFAGNARVLVATTALNAGTGAVTSFSNATTDPDRAALINRNLNNTPNDPTDDTVTVTVNQGGAIAGPKTFVYNSTTGVVASNAGYAFAAFKPTNISDQSILIAGASASGQSFAGLEVTVDSATSATEGAGFGGNALSGPVPTGTLTYAGAAVGATQVAGSSTTSAYGGTSSIAANFSNGTVAGTLDFTGSTVDVTFNGAMSSDKATYTGSSFTLGGQAATGQVKGGFFGPNYVETAGVFDLQRDTTKVGGVFGGQLPP